MSERLFFLTHAGTSGRVCSPDRDPIAFTADKVAEMRDFYEQRLHSRLDAISVEDWVDRYKRPLFEALARAKHAANRNHGENEDKGSDA